MIGRGGHRSQWKAWEYFPLYDAIDRLREGWSLWAAAEWLSKRLNRSVHGCHRKLCRHSRWNREELLIR